jgi:hypothetical protein
VGITILMIAAISFSALGLIFRHGRNRELLPPGNGALIVPQP